MRVQPPGPDRGSRPPAVVLRSAVAQDDDDVLAHNLAEEVNLAPMDRERLGYLRSRADRFDVVEVDGHAAGFVVTMRPGTDYDSPHYRWFLERYGAHFYYLDRITLAPAVRRRGVAGRVYDEVEAAAAPYGRMALEVNLVPPNPASLAFHTGRGYAEVGRLGDEEHLVVLMTKDLCGATG